MSLQTEAMRQTDDRFIDAGQRVDHRDELWYGYEMVNHPTPSGCERWMMTYSDDEGFLTKAEAIEGFKIKIAKLEELTAKFLSK